MHDLRIPDPRAERPIKLLLVDDDPAFCHLCCRALRRAGIEHTVAGSSREALSLLAPDAEAFDLILLDMELPGMNGSELLELLRDRGCDVPVIFVSVVDDPRVKTSTFDLGADDYVVKPFDFEELLARLTTVLRRSRRQRGLRFGDLEIDSSLRRTRSRGRPVDLAPREFALLQILAGEQGKVVTPAELVRRVWHRDPDLGTNSLRVNISRLKHKLARLSRVRVETIHGLGYRLVDDARPAQLS